MSFDSYTVGLPSFSGHEVLASLAQSGKECAAGAYNALVKVLAGATRDVLVDEGKRDLKQRKWSYIAAGAAMVAVPVVTLVTIARYWRNNTVEHAVGNHIVTIPSERGEVTCSVAELAAYMGMLEANVRAQLIAELRETHPNAAESLIEKLKSQTEGVE